MLSLITVHVFRKHFPHHQAAAGVAPVTNKTISLLTPNIVNFLVRGSILN